MKPLEWLTELNEWIEKEFRGYGRALRTRDEPPLEGEPWMSMAEAKELTRRAVAEFGSMPIVRSATEVLLAERGKTHGKFEDHARVTQFLKAYMDKENVYDKLNPRQAEALDMILHKIGRIAAGNPNWKDHWDDIAGYAKLGSEACA